MLRSGLFHYILKQRAGSRLLSELFNAAPQLWRLGDWHKAAKLTFANHACLQRSIRQVRSDKDGGEREVFIY
jgi:hypothetical protein